MSDLREYLWIAVLGGICGFFYGFLIGANDVANAFASTVSSKSVTLKQAVLIASVCEFSGAFFLGASVTSTVRNKLFDPSIYENEPEVLMFGMFTSLLTASTMLFLATHFGLPVSTTHDIVGCILGFSIAAKGFGSIQWDVITKVILSWVASPLVSGFIAFLFFGATKMFILKSDNAYQRAYYAFPIVLFIGLGIDIFYVLTKAANNYENYMEHLHMYWVLPVSFGTGLVAGLLWIFVFGRCAKRKTDRLREERLRAQGTDEASVSEEVKEQAFPQSKEIDEDDANEEIDEEVDEDDLEYDDEGHVFKVTKSVPKNTIAVQDKDLEDPEAIESTEEEDEELEAAPETYGQNQSTFMQKSMHAYRKFADNTFDQDLHTKSMHESPKAAAIWDKG
jgi:phosphate/sulfate permease